MDLLWTYYGLTMDLERINLILMGFYNGIKRTKK